jgi:hypothetical protein
MLFNVTRDLGKSSESSSDRGLKLDTLHLKSCSGCNWVRYWVFMFQGLKSLTQQETGVIHSVLRIPGPKFRFLYLTEMC